MTIAFYCVLSFCLFCIWAALAVQIRRIDRIEHRNNINCSRLKFQFDLIQTIRDDAGRLERSDDAKRPPFTTSGSPGDVHPFCPDAFITTKDLL